MSSKPEIMRVILIFVFSLLAFFYLGALIQKIAPKFHHGILGFVILLLGMFIGFFGNYWIPSPWSTYLGTFFLGGGIGMSFHHLLSKRYFLSENFEHHFVKKHETKVDRFIEILPGALTWTFLTSPIWLSFAYPFAVAYLILIADAYWLISAIRGAILMTIGYRRVQSAKRKPWLEMLKKDFPEEWQDYYHMVIFPVYKEGPEVLKPGFDAVVNSNYPKDKLILAVGFEERSKPQEIHQENIAYLESLKKKLGGVFMSFHPADLPGEVAGPATNKNWVIKNAAKEFKELGIDPEKVLVTLLDADYVIHHEFLAGALHKYLETPADVRNKRSYTGAFFFYNNYWQAPTPMRLIATGSAFWQLVEMVGSDKYQNYSSMSINFKSLTDIGGWISDKVNDDSGFYWKAYFHYAGDYKVISHYLPISGDTVLDVNLVKTFDNQYQQLKRWAYGVEHLPYITKEYFRRNDINFWDKTDKLSFFIWANLRWGTLALIVTFAGLVIPYLNPYYAETAVSINLPIVSSWILTAAFVGLFATIFVQEKTVPPRPKNWPFIQKVWSYLQYILVPVVLVTLSTIPAIHAQTQLMLGRHMQYRATVKARKETE